MAALRCKHEALVVLSGSKFVLYSNGEEAVHELPVECKEDSDEEEKKPRKDVTKTAVVNCVLAVAFSDSGKYFAIGDNSKRLHLYAASKEWKLISTRTLARRCTALAFTHSEEELVVADRTGDVYRYSVTEPDGAGNLLLGHLSMVLDLTLTSDDKYIITCDRDEKVRISHYPNAYNIHSYCLLHTEYVSQVAYIGRLQCLVSGSGDGRIATWDLDGTCHDSVLEEGRSESVGDQTGALEPGLSVKRIAVDDASGLLAVIYNRSRKLHIYQLHSNSGKVKLTHRQEVELLGEPWDICFDAQHRLWALQACENDAIAIYTCKKDEDQLQVMKSQNDESVKHIVDKLNAKWDLLNAAVDWRTDFISMSKIKSFDNVQKYLEKKEERLKGVKPVTVEPPEKKEERLKGAKPVTVEPPEKKLKSSG